ncbi:MAG: SRPBCC family protein [Candidatus Acidiferrales bacterium]
MENAAKKSRSLAVTALGDRELAMSREFDAPRDLLVEAWTTPELLKRWLYGPEDWRLKVCRIDLRVGGAIRFEWHHHDGTIMGMSGVYREIALPGRLVWTEIFDEDWTGGETLVTMTFAEKSGKTTATQTVQYSSRAARDSALKTGMAKGMDQSYDRLVELLQEMRR